MTHGRCGSTFLCRLFSQYDNISANTEIARNFPEKINNRIWDRDLKEKIQKHYPYENFDEFVESMRMLCDKKFMSFKIFPYQAKKVSWSFENQKNSSFIILKRNILDSYLSYVIAEKNNIWESKDTTENRTKFCPHKFKIYYNDTNKNINKINETIENSPHLKLNFIKVDYEEFMCETKQDKFMKKIFNFLKIKNMKKCEPKIFIAKEKQNKNKNFNFVGNKQQMFEFMKSNEVFKKILNESIYSNLPI